MANESGSTNWFQMFQRGQHYMKTWPADKRLAPVFPENRVSSVTRFAIRFMPPLAIFTLTWQIAMGGQLGLRYLNGQRAPFSQQCLQPGIDGADLIA